MRSLVTLMASLLLLTACSGGNQFDDLDAKMADSSS